MKQRKPRVFTSIGGQALIEGIMMRGPKKSAMAVRHVSGEIREKVWDTEASPRAGKIPLVRGVVNFVLSMIVGYRCMMESAEMSGMDEELSGETAAKETASEETPADATAIEETPPGEPEETADSGAAEPAASPAVAAVSAERDAQKNKEKSNTPMALLMAVSGVLAVVLAVALFLWLPTLLSGWLRDLFPALNGDAWYARLFRGGFEGILKIALFVGYIAVIALMKDIHRVFQYHGAEHKTIFCYEAGLPLTVENVRKQSRFHPRCGTSFMILMLLVGVLVSMLVPANIGALARTALKLLTVPLIMGLGYELLKLAGRYDNLATRILSAPGLWVQRLTTKEPADEMIECAIAAMNRVIPENGEDMPRDGVHL